MAETTRNATSQATRERGQQVRARREELDWTQDELALKSGCSVTTVKRIERGIGEEPKELRKVLATLGLTPLGLTPSGGLGRNAATGVQVASTQPSMGTIAGHQQPTSAVLLEAIRADMVLMAVRNRDPYEVIQALEAASPPPGTGIAWWAGHYRGLLEQHGVMPKREGPKR